ncbi:hypothetical protein AjGTCBM29_02251 [Aeromonas jandaei]|nr:hypothetical protein AjGTCBM29_02251 [Aeromonas jandaei]
MRISMLSVAIGLILSTGPVMAMQSADTPDVVGHKPTIGSAAIDKAAANLGDTLNVTYSNYDDIDGDAEGAVLVEWLRDGIADPGQTSSSYTPTLELSTGRACTDFSVTANVTPTSRTGDPRTGDAVPTGATQITVPTIPGYLKPDVVQREFADAEAFCRSQGMVLPTLAEALSLFNTYTHGGTNTDLATKYGWPLAGLCGGKVNLLWTRDLRGVGRAGVATHDGSVWTLNESGHSVHTTCVPSADTPPVASNVSFNAPVANSNVTATWTYTDAEGDAESGTTVEWLVNGNVVGTGNPWRVVGTHSFNNLTARVTPKAATGITDGTPVTSPGQLIKAADLMGFIAPDTNTGLRNQADAMARCAMMGARLVSAGNLQVLLSNVPGVGLNPRALCDVYGWPCHKGYMTSTTGSASDYMVVTGIPTLGNTWEAPKTITDAVDVCIR